jgi:hypothetical protein
MSDRAFFGMLGLTLISSVMVLIKQPAAAVAPALMFFLIGFDTLASAIEARSGETTQIGSTEGENAARQGTPK